MSNTDVGLDPPFADDGPIAQTPYTLRRRMHWGDSDPAQIGYTAKHIDFALEAAECWWENVLGRDWLQLRHEGFGSPVVALNAEYRKPIQPGDRMDLKVFVSKLGRSSIELRTEGYRVGHEEAEPHFIVNLTEVLITHHGPLQIRAAAFDEDYRRRIANYRRDCELVADGLATIEQIIDFWFGVPGDPGRGKRREIWWQSTPELDAEIRERFEATWEAGLRGDLDHWLDTRRGALALVILLDQFPRNMFRKSARAFSSDSKAMAVAREAIERGHDRDWPMAVGCFYYMPFEHSEDLADQERCLELFSAFEGEEDYEMTRGYVVEHRDIIARFGRFPHRNAVLGRESTDEERRYLEDPEVGFGQ